jgi:hypothetical protein
MPRRTAAKSRARSRSRSRSRSPSLPRMSNPTFMKVVVALRERAGKKGGKMPRVGTQEYERARRHYDRMKR